jgi:hypothetical protein
MAQRLQQVLANCHHSNRERVRQELEAANRSEGQTLWELVLSSFGENTEWVAIELLP